jgi:hypothetical protein
VQGRADALTLLGKPYADDWLTNAPGSGVAPLFSKFGEMKSLAPATMAQSAKSSLDQAIDQLSSNPYSAMNWAAGQLGMQYAFSIGTLQGGEMYPGSGVYGFWDDGVSLVVPPSGDWTLTMDKTRMISEADGTTTLDRFYASMTASSTDWIGFSRSTRDGNNMLLRTIEAERNFQTDTAYWKVFSKTAGGSVGLDVRFNPGMALQYMSAAAQTALLGGQLYVHTGKQGTAAQEWGSTYSIDKELDANSDGVVDGRMALESTYRQTGRGQTVMTGFAYESGVNRVSSMGIWNQPNNNLSPTFVATSVRYVVELSEPDEFLRQYEYGAIYASVLAGGTVVLTPAVYRSLLPPVSPTLSWGISFAGDLQWEDASDRIELESWAAGAKVKLEY